jgi:tetratricopeptide (TPR) repeat protein
MSSGGEGRIDSPILISYTGPDLMWAEWVREQLERAGQIAEPVEWSGAPADAGEVLRQAASGYRHCIAVFSGNYLRAVIPTARAADDTATWAAEHPDVLIPVLVRRCDLPARFWQLDPVDLREVSDDRTATRRLLSRVLKAGSMAPGPLAEPMTRFPGRRPTVWAPDLPGQNQFFTGRDEILRELRGRLTTDTAALVPYLLHGVPGVGKSQLAVEYAYRFGSDYDIVWWVPAGKPSTARKAMADLAVRLDLGGTLTEPGELIRAVKDALRTGYQRWLLIFDNASKPDEIMPVMPSGTSYGHVLVTSRDQTWNRHANALAVDVYSRKESIDFLRRRGPSLSVADAERLAGQLGDMPLALEHAASWLSTTRMALDDYLSLLSKHTAEVLGAGLDSEQASAVATWAISMTHLREASPEAATLLELCAFFGPDPVSLNFIASAPADAVPGELRDALRSPGRRVKILQAIGSYSLARVSEGLDREPSLQSHRLVQAVTRDLLTPEQRAAYRRSAYAILAAAIPGDPKLPANWPRYDALLPHVISSEAISDPDPGLRALVMNETNMLNLRGEYRSALDILAAAIPAWSAVLDEVDHELVDARREQAKALRGLGRHREALAVAKAGYELARERLGQDHPDTLRQIGGLAGTYRRLGDFAVARGLEEFAVDVLTREGGADDPETLRHAHNLAVDHRMAGEFAQALEIDRHGTETFQRILGPDAYSTLYAVNNMARDLRELGQYYEALALQEQTYSRYREVFGPDSPDTLRAMKNLAVTRRKAGRYEDAAELAEDVLDRHRRKFGDLHPETLAAITNFANDKRCLGQFGPGRGYAELAVRGFQEVLGPDHPFTAGAEVNLAALLRLTGSPEQARTLNARILERLQAGFGAAHRYPLSCAVNLASDLAALDALEEARELDDQTLTALRTVSGADHPYTLSCAINLALDLRALGERDAYRDLFGDTVERYERTLGAGHPEAVAAAARERAVCDFEPPPV